MTRIIALSICVMLCSGSFAQTELPSVVLEKMDGTPINTDAINNAEGPTIISFWATWCKPCIMELNELNDVYEDWKDETNVNIVAISIDDARSSGKVNAFVKGRRWDFDVYLDKNSDLKRALNISNVPFSLVLDKEGKIISRHAGYVPGDEELLYEEITGSVQ